MYDSPIPEIWSLTLTSILGHQGSDRTALRGGDLNETAD